MSFPKKLQQGFSLIELAVVMVIIGLILGGIFKGQSALVQGGRTHDAIQIASDLSGIMIEFKNKYHYLPGDFPNNGEIDGVLADCTTGGSKLGNGNGLIGPSLPTDANDESACVPEHLAKAGYIKAEIDPATNLAVIKSGYGRVRVIANRVDGLLPSKFVNVIEFVGVDAGSPALPCDVALEIDRKIDDGNLATGNVRSDAASVACSPDGGSVILLAVGF